MKITKTQLRRIIKEEKAKLQEDEYARTRYEYDPQDEIYAIQQHLSDAAMKLMELSRFIESSDGRKAVHLDSLSRQIEKIQRVVETHVQALENMPK